MAELKKLDKQCWTTIGSGYKDSTKDNIKSQYDIYKRFCNYYFLKKFPANSWQLCRFAQFLYSKNRAPSTIANAISTVHTLQALKGHPVPDLYDVSIRLQLKGLKNISKKVKKQAKSMTPQLLKDMAKLVQKDSPLQFVSFTAILTGFYLLLRKSNLVPDSITGKGQFNGSKQLQRQDLKLGKRTILVDIKWTKTQQKMGKPLQLPILPLVTKDLCAINWITSMVKKYPAQPDSPLFVVPNKKGEWVPLTYSRLSKQLKDWMEKLTGERTGWSLHSLRRVGQRGVLT